MDRRQLLYAGAATIGLGLALACGMGEPGSADGVPPHDDPLSAIDLPLAGGKVVDRGPYSVDIEHSKGGKALFDQYDAAVVAGGWERVSEIPELRVRGYSYPAWEDAYAAANPDAEGMVLFVYQEKQGKGARIKLRFGTAP